MGCFLGCFGYSTKHKRRKPANKFLLQGDQVQGLCSYEPLESSFSQKLDITDSGFRDNNPKERSSLRIRKKVSFNLNVTTYEPIPTHDDSTHTFLGSEDGEESSGRSKEDTEKEKEKSSPEENSVDSGTESYPSNYRYHNCEDSYYDEEDEELEFEENDLDDDDDDDDDDYDESDDGGNNVDDLRTRQEFSEKICSVSVESQKIVTATQMADEKTKTLEWNKNARDRSHYVYSVLKPVENLTQWKEIKAKSKPPVNHHQRKENTAILQSPHSPFSSTANEPLLFESPVDASLSNWLASSEIMPLKRKPWEEVISEVSEFHRPNRGPHDFWNQKQTM